ncbi:MAG: hypothetical protein KKC68_05690 [Candidatus Thermoplasmatota archaeon]|nr:hypothetical protein [Candidatus Thermoplasmatota archaeon]MBU1941248.1 hypothetical protein [Candidatus Thermoplasmatota archaeon]
MRRKKPSSKFIFTPVAVDVTDDVFHGSRSLQFTEWWYFDAFFDNGYSAQMSIRILSGLHLVFTIIRFDIYKDAKLVSHQKKTVRLKKVKLSKDKPLVSINNIPFISGSYDKKTGLWTFDLDFSLEDNKATLHFDGTTPGWKAQHRGGDWWAVTQPKAKVTGELCIGNDTFPVSGFGYHDHNWEVHLGATRNYGWFWGKIYSKTNTLTWSSVMRTISDETRLLVINTDGGSYINIPEKSIIFETIDHHMDHGKNIPHQLSLKAKHESYAVDVSMKVLDVHHVRVMTFIHYWRLHVHCTGSITTEKGVETIDDVFMAEYVRFS